MTSVTCVRVSEAVAFLKYIYACKELPKVSITRVVLPYTALSQDKIQTLLNVSVIQCNF